MAGKTGVWVNGNEHRRGLPESKRGLHWVLESKSMSCLKSREKKVKGNSPWCLGLTILKGKLMTTYQIHGSYICLCSGKNKLGNNILLSSANQSGNKMLQSENVWWIYLAKSLLCMDAFGCLDVSKWCSLAMGCLPTIASVMFQSYNWIRNKEDGSKISQKICIGSKKQISQRPKVLVILLVYNISERKLIA